MKRGGLFWAGLMAGLFALPVAGAAQQIDQPPPQSSILTIAPDRLFTESAYGRTVLQRLEVRALALQAENNKIDAALEAEEKTLTDQRGTLPAADFKARAEAFDQKVEGIRAAQAAKGQALADEREAERKKVLEAALPVLGQLMTDRGAVAILNKESVFLSFDRIDVTEEAIARIDAALGDGNGSAPAP